MINIFLSLFFFSKNRLNEKETFIINKTCFASDMIINQNNKNINIYFNFL